MTQMVEAKIIGKEITRWLGTDVHAGEEFQLQEQAWERDE